MMKRMISLLLTLALLLTTAAAAADETAEAKEFVVGSTTQLKGDFFTGAFGNNGADGDVRLLIQGYNLVHWDNAQGLYIFDPSVTESVTVKADQEGNKVYTIKLRDDLYYSNGAPITAWDYAFSFLLSLAPEMTQIGGKIERSGHLLGSEAYMSGEKPYLEGLGVTDELTLKVVLDKNYLPYFYEQGLLMCVPFPITEIAPGCRVYADGEKRDWDAEPVEDEYEAYYGMGAYIGNDDLTEAEPVFTAEMLEMTLLDPENGYNTHPQVVSGPYRLTGFDGTTAHFELNEYYKGSLKSTLTSGRDPYGISVEGNDPMKADELVKPTIERIAYTLTTNDTVIRDLREGRLDLANKVMYGDAVDSGRWEVNNNRLKSDDYAREGLAYLTFSFDRPCVGEQAVRQALAWCMDRNRIAKDYCGVNGRIVDGFYGMECWEYLLASGKMRLAVNFKNDAAPSGVQKHSTAKGTNWSEINLKNLTTYKVDTAKAAMLLKNAGWTLNEDGSDYTGEAGKVRCKEIDGQIVPLRLTLLIPEGHHIADLLQDSFIKNLNACGIELTVETAPMNDVLRQYYRETERTADMIFLATNFGSIYDPSVDLSTDPTGWNFVYSDDEELYRLAVDMRKTNPKETVQYMQKWVAFQERYNQVLPTLPVYTNVYYDFYTTKLRNYHITSHSSWAQAIIEASLAK
ncbi:MAG: hypothetical protein IKH18_09365 [Clostridia bacterium]|nr:hypothetical protein [Clostridia bacterium]